MEKALEAPLVSVIIPCYNHGQYLADGINSVLEQTWSPIEIIVVDDGSVDNTRAVAEQFPSVKYVYQTNQGLSAARNTGTRHSSGEFLSFLDADDWLYPEGIAYNVRQLMAHPEAAFISGAHDKVDDNRQLLADECNVVNQDHYLRLLESNYIGMHATVLYRRSVLDEFEFDTSLKACEDYDLYLKIARQKPVLHSTKKIASYRIHGSNMSGNVPLMLNSVFDVLARQLKDIRTKEEKQSYKRGRRIWSDYYGQEVYKRLLNNAFVGKETAEREALLMLRKYNSNLFIRYWTHKLIPRLNRS
jgi:glycosyltransferase involved in cell wall biosynthesis